MALARARRSESPFNYWPGFVDALSTLVLSIVFLLTVPLMRGRWSPRKARADEEAHEAMIQAEMDKLGLTASV